MKPKEAIKKAVKVVVALPIIIKIVAIVLLSSIIVTALDWVIEIFTAKNNPEDIYSIFEVEDVAELVEIKKSTDGTGYYLDFVSDFDEKAEKIIEKSNNSAGLHNLPNSTGFLKKIIKAEVITQFPNLGGNIPDESTGFQGAIDIRRVTPNKEIGSISDNPGRGETTTLEQDTVYDSVETNSVREDIVKQWSSGQKLIIVNGKATVYEQEESTLNPGTYIDYWHEKLKEGKLDEYVTIADGTEVTYTGTYKTNTNKLTNEVVVYVEVDTGKEKVFVKSTHLKVKEEETDEQTSSMGQANIKLGNKATTSRAEDDSREEKTAGKEGQTYTIAIAAGHNNSDNVGARSGDLKEEELTIKTAEKVEELLQQYSNIKVVQVGSTSQNRSGIKVTERTALARNANPDLCIQIHYNAGGGTGVEAIYKDGDGISQQLAEILSDSISTSMGLTNRGAGPDVEKCAVGSLGIIENTATSGFPSVVTEGGFIDGEPDATLLKENGVDLYAEGIVEGILKYLVADHSGYTSVSIESQSSQESVESRVYNLKYVTQDEFEDLLSNANGGDNEAKNKVLKVFTLDDNNNLVTATWSLLENGSIEYKKNSAMSFKTMLQKYIMPYEYLLYFYMDTNETEFSEKLAEEVFKTEIVIAVQDNVTTTRRKEMTTEKQVATISDYSYEKQISSKTITTETCTPKIEVTYADAWCVKYYKENSYSKKALDWKDGEEEKIINIKGKVTTSNVPSTTGDQVVLYGVGNTHERDEDGREITYRYTKYQRTDTVQDTMSIQYDTGDAKVEGNANKFVKLYNETKMYKLVRKNGYLYKIIENNEKTANLLDLTKYLIYEATGISSGVKEYDFSEFDLNSYSSITGIYGSTLQEKVWFTLRRAGFSEYAVAGVMGNIEAESGFNAGSIEEGNGIGIGICQWSYGRREQLEKYAQSKGVSWTDEDTQIEFLLGELTPGGGADGYASYALVTYKGYSPDDWKNAQNVEEATKAFCWSFERPGIPHMDRRIEAANKYYNEFKGKTAPAGDTRIGTITLSGDNASKMMDMLTEALRIADDDRYTYSQSNRYGEFQYDCSSLVARLYKKYFNFDAPSTTRGYGSAYHVGKDGSVELKPGDVLWKSGHVEIYIGNGLQVGAHTDTCAIPDQISVVSYTKGYFTDVYRFIE